MKSAILRKPGINFVNALTQQRNSVKPDYHQALIEHAQYAATLEKMGVTVNVCEPDESFPDGNFVEDTHLILDGKIIIELNPGASSRAGEPMSLAPYLPSDIPRCCIDKRYTMDGGDVLQDGKKLYVGLSKRTQPEAIDALADIVMPLGYDIYALDVPQGLHLKSGMTCLMPSHFVLQESFEPLINSIQKVDTSVRYFIVPPEEAFAANLLPINGKIMIAAGCPKTRKYIEHFYHPDEIFEVDTQQVRLVDGALTCGCLLW